MKRGALGELIQKPFDSPNVEWWSCPRGMESVPNDEMVAYPSGFFRRPFCLSMTIASCRDTHEVFELLQKKVDRKPNNAKVPLRVKNALGRVPVATVFALFATYSLRYFMTDPISIILFPICSTFGIQQCCWRCTLLVISVVGLMQIVHAPFCVVCNYNPEH